MTNETRTRRMSLNVEHLAAKMQRRRELTAAHARASVGDALLRCLCMCVYISGHLPVLSVQVASPLPLDLLSNQILVLLRLWTRAPVGLRSRGCP